MASEASSAELNAVLRDFLENDVNYRSHAAWARELGVSPSAVSQWASGKTIPKPNRLREIIQKANNDGAARRYAAVARLPGNDWFRQRLGADSLERYVSKGIRQQVLKLVEDMDGDEQLQAVFDATKLIAADRTDGGEADWGDLQCRAAQVMEELGASSVTVYLSRHHLYNDQQLIAHAGLQFAQVQRGPRMARQEDAPRYSTNPVFCSMPDQRPWRLPTKLPSKVGFQELYESFVDREHVNSYVRLHVGGDSSDQCIVFANYREFRTFDDDAEKAHIERVLLKLAIRARGHRLSLTAHEREALRGANTAVADLCHKLEEWVSNTSQTVPHRYWLEAGATMVRALASAFGLGTPGEHFEARLFLPCDRKANSLGSVPIALINRPATVDSVLRCNVGIGLSVWAHLRQRVLWLESVKDSAFQTLCTPEERSLESVLVIPVFSASRLVAVLHLGWRSRLTQSRIGSLLRPLALAVEQMLTRLESFALQSVHSLLRAPEPKSRSHVVKMTKHHFGLQGCDAWLMHSVGHRVERATRWLASSYARSQVGDGPRDRGWSNYVVSHDTCVFISDNEGLEFNDNDGTWAAAERNGAPQSPNAAWTSLGVTSELGIPIQWGSHRGVLWMKLGRGERPDPYFMNAVLAFRAIAGRILSDEFSETLAAPASNVGASAPSDSGPRSDEHVPLSVAPSRGAARAPVSK